MEQARQIEAMFGDMEAHSLTDVLLHERFFDDAAAWSVRAIG